MCTAWELDLETGVRGKFGPKLLALEKYESESKCRFSFISYVLGQITKDP